MKHLLRRAATVVAFSCALLTPCVHATPGQPGTLDATWATSSPLGAGKLITPIGSGNDQANSITLQPDGKVLLAGNCINGATVDFCAVRYLANGTLDTTWNGTGKVSTPIGTGGDASANAMTLQPDGKVLLAGPCWNGTYDDFCAARYLANGTLDITWNGTGKVITAFGGGVGGTANAMTLQPDGKVLLAGICANFSSPNFCAARYLANGSLDTTWNSTGKIITFIGSGYANASSMTLQPDGKVLLAGSCSNAFNFDFCTVRYLADGSLDATWGGTGKVITPIGTGYDYGKTITLQPDGKVLVAGYCAGATNYDFCAARYLANGTLDTSWNSTGTSPGTVITTIGTGTSNAISMTLQPDGRVLLAGHCSNGTNYDFCAARYLANGTLDTTWNSTGTSPGKVITAIGGGGDYARAVMLQPDGKVLVAGYCSNGANDDFCAARYDGGPFGYQNCKPDIDGDGSFLATTDALIYTRIALGITGPAVIGGITFAPTATRNTWPLIRDYLVTQCGMSLVQ